LRYLNPAKLESKTFIRPDVQSAGSVNSGLGNSYQERECKDLLELSLPQLLHFEDRLSMSQSIEVRVPFLDHRIVELAATISPNNKFRGGWSKSILRDAIAEIVPPSIRFRKDKKGFTIPEAKWMRNEFVRPYQNMLAKPMLAHEFGIIDQEKATSQYANFLKGKSFLNARHFFRLYLFEAFLRRYEDFILPVNMNT
jgi:asparagine synthase (glutamine-hydrolysing)